MSGKLNKTKNIFYDMAICLPQILLLALLYYTKATSYVDSFALYFIFFYLGVFISRFRAFTVFILNITVFAFAFIIFLVMAGWYSFTTPNLVIKLILSVTAIFSLYYIVNTIIWQPFIDKTITGWGQHSLAIYVTQFSLIYIFPESFKLPALHVVLLLGITFFFSLVVIILCISIFNIVKLCPPLSLLLHGNKDNNRLISNGVK